MDMTALVNTLQAQVLKDWWECSTGFANLGAPVSPVRQQTNARRLDEFMDDLLERIRRAPGHADGRAAWQQGLIDNGLDFASASLELTGPQMALVRQGGFIESSQEFARAARRFDPAISTADIYQAARNVMTMNFMQLLLGCKVELTPSVFAYSMLYPYTDNYIDDPAVSQAAKAGFNRRFLQRIRGEEVEAHNQHEEKIYQLIGLIEGQFDRWAYPQVYASLEAIHAGQARSLTLNRPVADTGKGPSPFEADVIGLTLEKGGTSVLADGYLVAGDLSYEAALYAYHYGAFTQMMDDLEDVVSDQAAGRMTIFSVTAGRWPLDAITNRVVRFGQVLFERMHAFQSETARELQGLIEGNMHPVLFDTAYRVRQFYTRAYLRRLEQYMPYPFRALERQRHKLEKRRASFSGLVEVFI